MTVQDDCESCDHKKRPDGGWCYVFKEKPTETCMQHTRFKNATRNWALRIALGSYFGKNHG